MRHAKSSWKVQGQNDFDRPLKKRGRKNARQAAKTLVDLGWSPDYSLLSPSCRTRETFEEMAPLLENFLYPDTRESLYHPTVEGIADEVRSIDSEVESLLLISHNPACEEFLSLLIPESESMKTAAMALLEIKASTWAEAVARNTWWNFQRGSIRWHLSHFFTPTNQYRP